MMPRKHLLSLSLLAASACVPFASLAQQPGFFAGLDAAVGTTRGSSSTRDGGGDFGAGGIGIVSDVKFEHTTGIGGHLGYRFDSPWSVFLSYQYTRSDIRWRADFPAYDSRTDFSGKAFSHTILANVGYAFPLTEATTLHATAGLGVAFNALSDVVERNAATGQFASDVADHTHTSPAARLGIGLHYAATRHTLISLDAAVTYQGSFHTGKTRSGNLGITAITPYEIDDVWHASLGASVSVMF